MATTKITIPGVGSVIADIERGSLRPNTHVVAQRLCVGFHADTTAQKDKADKRREAIAAEATKRLGNPEFGWQWIDHNGHTIY